MAVPRVFRETVEIAGDRLPNPHGAGEVQIDNAALGQLAEGGTNLFIAGTAIVTVDEFMGMTAVGDLDTLTLSLGDILVGGIGQWGGTDITFGMPSIGGMQAEIEQLKKRVAALESEVEALKVLTDEEIIVLRTVSREQAKREIRELYSKGDVYYISEVAERLSLPDDQVVSVIQELADEGEIQQNE